jgi:hypothetical protein
MHLAIVVDVDPKFEAIMQGLQDTMTVMEGLERRQAERQEEHQKWLEDLHFVCSKHNQAWQRHEEAWKRHQEWLIEQEEAWKRHQEWLIEHDRAIAEHKEWQAAHDRAMAEMDVKLNNLIANIDRFVQGRNIN